MRLLAAKLGLLPSEYVEESWDSTQLFGFALVKGFATHIKYKIRGATVWTKVKIPEDVRSQFDFRTEFYLADLSIDQNGEYRNNPLKGFTEVKGSLFQGHDLYDPEFIVETDGSPWPPGLSCQGQFLQEKASQVGIGQCTLTLWLKDTKPSDGVCFQKKFSTGRDAMAVLCECDEWVDKYDVYAATIETTDGKVYKFNPGFTVIEDDEEQYTAPALARVKTTRPPGSHLNVYDHDGPVKFCFANDVSEGCIFSNHFMTKEAALNFHYQCLNEGEGVYCDCAVLMRKNWEGRWCEIIFTYHNASEMAQYEDDINALKEGEKWTHPKQANVQLIAVMENGKQKLQCANDETFEYFLRLVRESLSEMDFHWNATGDTGTIHFDPTIALNESHVMTFIKEKLILTTEQSEAVAFRLSLDKEIAKAGSASSVIKASPSAKKDMNYHIGKDMKKEKKKQEKKEAKKDRKKVEWTSPAEKEKMDAASAEKATKSRAAQKEKAKAAHVGAYEKAIEEEKEREFLFAKQQEVIRKKKQEQMAMRAAFISDDEQRWRDGEFEAHMAGMPEGEQKKLKEIVFPDPDPKPEKKGGGKRKGGGKKKK